jgi:hypothetical protein
VILLDVSLGSIFREVVKHKKIVHEYFDPYFENRGEMTLLNWYKLYETKELFEMVEKHHKKRRL